jgi:hypothetical protein
MVINYSSKKFITTAPGFEIVIFLIIVKAPVK